MRNRAQLVVFDMEGTLTTDPTVWELMHRKTGTWESHGCRYWEDFRAGRIDYDAFARKDVAAWSGAASELLDEAVNSVPLMSGCRELLEHLAALGAVTAIVSNGLERLALRVAGEFGIERVAANRERIRDGRLTGELDILVPYNAKAEALRHIAVETGARIEDALAVGDGTADIGMFRVAGRSIAFRPESQAVAAAATHVVRGDSLRDLIPLIL